MVKGITTEVGGEKKDQEQRIREGERRKRREEMDMKRLRKKEKN